MTDSNLAYVHVEGCWYAAEHRERNRIVSRTASTAPGLGVQRMAGLLASWARALGGAGLGVWAIKHVVSPLDRRLYAISGGRLLSTGRPLGPVLLLSTIGRRTGRVRTTPVFYLRDGERLILCNVTPASERANPWPLNLRAYPLARVQIGRRSATYLAREADAAEVARYWPRLVALWPAYDTHFSRTGHRVLFVLEPQSRVEG